MLLSKLPSKVKDNVVEVVVSGGSYQELKRALLKRVGPSLRELELEFFPQKRRSTQDRVEKAKEIIRLVEQTSMLCPTRNDFKLFLARACFVASCLLKETGLIRSREDRKVGGQPKCFFCAISLDIVL